MKNNIIKVFSLLTVLLVSLNCTDLEIEETDSLISEDVGTNFTGLSDPSSSLNDLYNTVGGTFQGQNNTFALSEVSTDELLVPTRGTDWGDNGVWRQLHNHTWSSSHLYVRDSWNALNSNVFRSTEIIESESDAEVAAEAKFLRALNMFFVMDLYGQVPFRGVNEGPDINPQVLPRPEAFDFIINDLQEALPDLADGSAGSSSPDKATKPAAYFLLAKLYLNAHIYKETSEAADSDLQQVVTNVENLEAAGFAIENGYFDIFEPTSDTETIFVTRSEVAPRIWNTLHYNLNAPDNDGGGWNGFSTLAEFYDTFEGATDTNYEGDNQEERRGWVPDPSNANDQNLGIGYGFLIGQQYEQDGNALTDRPGNPLVFEKEINSLVGNNERTGVRVIKYHPFDPTDTGDTDSPLINSFRQHLILFRFADAHLMKAEAIMRMGGDPTILVNELRSQRSNTSSLPSVNADILLEERGREMYIEFWRRNDLIRFAKFIEPWALKEVSGDETKNLYPIPLTAILSNPNLIQNPGY